MQQIPFVLLVVEDASADPAALKAGGGGGQPGPGAPPPPVHPVQVAGQQQPAPPAGVPQGPIQPPPRQQHAAPPHIVSYSDFFNTESKDPHQGNYAEVMLDFEAPVQGASRHNPGNLLTRVAAASASMHPFAFAMTFRDTNTPTDIGTVHIVHRVSTMPATVVGNPEVWDGNQYGLVNDLLTDHFPIIPVTETSFNRTQAGTQVLSDEAMLAEITTQPTGLVPLALANGENGVEVRTRFSMFVPFRAVNLLMGQNLEPKAAFQRIYTEAAASNAVDVYRPLLDYLKVAATATADGPSAVARPWPTLPRPPTETLLKFFGRLVDYDLPHRRAQAGTTADVGPVIRAIDDLTAEHRQGRIETQARHRASEDGRVPSQLFGMEGVARLMRLTNASSEAHLPTLSSELGQAPNAGRLILVQNRFNAGHLTLSIRSEQRCGWCQN